MINDLILRVRHNGVTTDLDVDGAVPLRLDISQVDNQNIGEVYGVSSQNFNLPGTSNNNKFFNHGYLESAVDVPGLYNTIECSVIRNGETLLLGTLQINEIVTSEDGFITYDVTVNSTVIEFNQALQDKFLYQADWTPYNHTLNGANVFKSWNPRSGSTNSFITPGGTGSVYYPYIDYGFDSIFTWPDFPVISVSSGSLLSGNSGSTALADNPLDLGQVYPAIGAREVFKAIFQQAGFDYSSSFIDSSEFDEVFVLTKNKEGLGIVAGPGQVSNGLFSGSVSASFDIPYTIGGNDNEAIVITSGDLYDPGNNYNIGTGFYTAVTPGTYDFALKVDFENSSKDVSIGDAPIYDLILNIDRVGLIQDQFDVVDNIALLTSSIDSDPFYTLQNTATTEMATGDRATMVFRVDNRAGGADTLATPVLTTSTFKVTDAPFDYQDLSVDMGAQIDNTIKTVDMFKALLTQFNLVAYPDQSQQRVINIETFDTWIRQGEVKDWTEKYNTAKRISIKNPVVEQPRELRFGNAEDDDRISKIAKESTPNFQYGTLRVISDSSLTEAEKKIESIFAPTVLGPTVALRSSSFSSDFTLNFNQDANNFIIPHLYKFNNNKQESFKFKPRIGYRSYYKDSGILNSGDTSYPISSSSDLASPALLGYQYMASGSSGDKIQFNNYSTLSNYKNYPVTSSTPDLLFNSSYNKISNSQTLYPSSGSSNYANYWKTYTESLYWNDGRKIVVDLFFEEYEYQDIKLNDQIIIGSNRYRINKIQGFNLTRRDVVTVELLKLFTAYSPVVTTGPLECPSVQTNAATSITASQFTANGEVISYGTDGVGSYVNTGFLLGLIGQTDPVIGDASTYTFWSGNTPAPAVNFSHVFAGLNPDTNYSYRAMISSSNPVCSDKIYGDTAYLTTLTSSLCDDFVSASYYNIQANAYTLKGTNTQVGGSQVPFNRGFVISSGSVTDPLLGGVGVKTVYFAINVYNTVSYNQQSSVTCNTDYYFRFFQQSTSTGCLIYSDLNTFTTLACPEEPCLPFSSSVATSFGAACGETITRQLWTDYDGTWPPTQAFLDGGGVMTVYTNNDCSTTSPNDYYAFDSTAANGSTVDAFLRVNDGGGANPGDVIQIYDCE